MATISKQDAQRMLFKTVGEVEEWPDFHGLSSDQALQLLEFAKAHNYRKPANANGSTARMFYKMLERKAGRCTA